MSKNLKPKKFVGEYFDSCCRLYNTAVDSKHCKIRLSPKIHRPVRRLKSCWENLFRNLCRGWKSSYSWFSYLSNIFFVISVLITLTVAGIDSAINRNPVDVMNVNLPLVTSKECSKWNFIFDPSSRQRNTHCISSKRLRS